jgi:hypothetical protein
MKTKPISKSKKTNAQDRLTKILIGFSAEERLTSVVEQIEQLIRWKDANIKLCLGDLKYEVLSEERQYLKKEIASHKESIKHCQALLRDLQKCLVSSGKILNDPLLKD